MKATNQSWTIRKFRRLRQTIDENPPFQRGEVWRTPAKQLLIDSILCQFDIPKIYLHDMGSQPLHRYAVADGQQRLRAIWGYLKDEYALANRSYAPNATWLNKKFSELTKRDKLRILNTRLITAVVEGNGDEVRELFWRLQQGSQLNPAEKRNCVPSQLGDIVRMIAETHSLFKKGAPALFSTYRRKRDDMCAHAFALEINKATKDLKAQNLRDLYDEYKAGIPSTVQSKVRRTLDFMHAMTTDTPGCIHRKWGFVDLYLLISTHEDEVPEAPELVKRFQAFERRRLKFNASPEKLLEGGRPSRQNRNLYDYIIAFKTSGAEAENIEKRHSILTQELLAT